MFTSKKGASFILALVLLLTSLNTNVAYGLAQPQDRSIVANYFETQANPNLTDEDKIKNAIDTYFKLRYEGQKLLQAQDFSVLLADKTQSWVQKEKDKRDVELYIASTYRLNYVDYKYVLDYDSLEVQGTTSIIHLRESHDVVFEAIKPVVSKLANLKHVVTLRKVKSGWVILTDEYQDDLSRQMATQTKESLIRQVNLNHEADMARASGVGSNGAITPYYTSYSYDRSRAVSYADTYWNGTGPYYAREAEDCANFVSQSIYSGEGKNPPDQSGMSDTRDYSTSWYYNFAGTPSGSLPWIQVDKLANFLTTNSAKGPYGSASNICSIQVGDVIYWYNSPADGHSMLLAQIIGPCSSLSWFLVDAHTDDRYHYPLSYYASHPLQYIHINGWRG